MHLFMIYLIYIYMYIIYTSIKNTSKTTNIQASGDRKGTLGIPPFVKRERKEVYQSDELMGALRKNVYGGLFDAVSYHF